MLVNPPSPEGRTVNREGFGGLGLVTSGAKGFVYPAQRLAEAAGWLRLKGRAPVGLDFVLESKRSSRALGKAAGVEALVVHVSSCNLAADLDWVEAVPESLRTARLVLTGVGLGHHESVVAERFPDAILDHGPTGYSAARRALGEDGDPGAPDSWPHACWETMPLVRSRRLPVYHGRGCTYGCAYCPYVVGTDGRHLVRSAERVMDEVMTQSRRHRPKRLVFRDPAFGLDAEGTRELLELLTNRTGRDRLPFEVESRPELLPDPVLDALAAAGCVELKLGVESLEPRVLVATRRVADEGEAASYRESVERVLAGATARRMVVRPFLMSQLPGSTSAGEEAARAHVARWAPPVVKELIGLEGGGDAPVG